MDDLDAVIATVGLAAAGLLPETVREAPASHLIGERRGSALAWIVAPAD